MTTRWAVNLLPAPDPPLPLTVSDVKQFPYCPRIVYYSYLLPVRSRPTTFKMEEGSRAHERIAALEERRSLRAYGLAEGRRQFDVAVASDRLGLRGRLDMIIETDAEVVPVDFKNSEGTVGLNHKYQITAYALLVEDVWGRPVRRGFIYLIPQQRAEEIRITSNMRGWVRKAYRRSARLWRERRCRRARGCAPAASTLSSAICIQMCGRLTQAYVVTLTVCSHAIAVTEVNAWPKS